MKVGLMARVDITIGAPIDRVWEGLTDPALVRQYFFGTELEADWVPGGRVFFRGNWNGAPYEDRAVITEIAPPRLVRYEYWSSMSGKPDLPENYAPVSYLLSPEGDQTLLTLLQGGIGSEEERRQSEENWRGVFGGLKELLERERAAKGGPLREARGGFTVETRPAGDPEEWGGMSFSTLRLEKEWEGGLSGHSSVTMMSAGTSVDGKMSAGYVALERITGRLDGRSGSFVCTHRALMDRGKGDLLVEVVPGSGTGELTGLTGRIAIEIVGGDHRYRFSYRLP